MHVFQDVALDENHRLSTDGERLVLLRDLEPVLNPETAAAILVHMVTNQLRTFPQWNAVHDIIRWDTKNLHDLQTLTDEEWECVLYDVSEHADANVAAQIKTVLLNCFPLLQHYTGVEGQVFYDGYAGSYLPIHGHSFTELHHDLPGLVQKTLGSTRKDAIKAVANADLASLSWVSLFNGLIPVDWAIEWLRNSPDTPAGLRPSDALWRLSCTAGAIDAFRAVLGGFKPGRRRHILFNTPHNADDMHHLEEILTILGDQQEVKCTTFAGIHSWEDAHFAAIRSIHAGLSATITVRGEHSYELPASDASIHLGEELLSWLDLHPDVRIPTTHAQYVEASRHLVNCLATPNYFEKTVNGEHLVFTVVDNDKRVVASVEVSLTATGDWVERQARGWRNRPLKGELRVRVDQYTQEMVVLLQKTTTIHSA